MQVHPKIQLTAFGGKKKPENLPDQLYLTLIIYTAISETMKCGKLTIRLRIDSIKFSALEKPTQ